MKRLRRFWRHIRPTDCVVKRPVLQVMKEGIAPEDLLQAVQAYAADSSGFTRSKVCFSDNWFRSRRWQAYVERQAEDREKTERSEPTTTNGWPAGSVTAARCANTSRLLR